MTSPRRRAAAVLAALSVVALAAGCGGDSDSGSGGSSSDFAKESPEKIADAAKSDMKELDAVHYSGEISSGGSAIKLDVQASAAGDCTGSVTLGDGTAEVLAVDGENWFRPDEAFWRQQVPDQADAVIAAVGDKWVVDTDKEFAQFCDLDEFFANVFSSDGEDNQYETVGTDELDGQDVVKVANTDEKGTSTGYVVVDDPHYLLKVERTEGDEPGQIEFTDFDEEFDVEAPATDEVVDLSQG